MNFEEKLKAFEESLPKEVKENYEKHGDEYLVLQTTFTQILDHMLRTYLFNSNTVCENNIIHELYASTKYYCDNFHITPELYAYVVRMAIYIVITMGEAIKSPTFKGWYAESLRRSEQVVREDRELVKRINANASVVKQIRESMRKDLLARYPEDVVCEMMKNFKIGDDGTIFTGFELIGRSSYNKDKKKTHEKSSKS